MTTVESNSLRRRWSFWQWPVVWSLAVLALALGVVGFTEWSARKPPSILDSLYQSLQLFVLGGNASGEMPWTLQVARFLAPAIAAYTATQALLAIFREQLLQLRLRFTRGHVVVCGLGRTGFKAASDFLARGQRVVVIEQESESDWIRPCEDLGGLVLIGNAADEAHLREARVDHARTLVIACGDDGANVEVAIRTGGVKNASAHRITPLLQCHVHIVDDDLRALFKTHRVFTDTADGVKVRLFNLYDASARLLFQRHPLDRERIGPNDPRRVHLIVIGFGQMGESVVLQAARIAHFANGRRLRVTVVDHEAAARERRFRLRNPQFDSVADLAFVGLEGDDPQFFATIAAWCAEADTLATVVVSFDNDTRSLSCALTLQPHLKPSHTPILIRMATDGGLTALLDSDSAGTRLDGMVRPFPPLQLSGDEGSFLEGDVDAEAMTIHAAYVTQRRKDGRTPETDAALLPWDELDEDLKDSNRQQADHRGVKLRALGIFNAADAKARGTTPLTADEIEMLARMEHARWNADRFLAGWTHAPGKKNIEKKTSPHLVSWAALPEEIKEYDRQAVRILRWSA